jgi:hypothetical protein
MSAQETPKRIGDKLRKVLAEHPEVRRNISLIKKMNTLVTRYPNKYKLDRTRYRIVLWQTNGYMVKVQDVDMKPLEDYYFAEPSFIATFGGPLTSSKF